MSDIILPNGMPSDAKFEEYQIHETLFIIRGSSKKNVIGYVSKDPIEGWWFWFIMNDISKSFQEKNDAIEDLIQTFLTVKFNAMAKKSGIFGNDKYVKH